MGGNCCTSREEDGKKHDPNAPVNLDPNAASQDMAAKAKEKSMEALNYAKSYDYKGKLEEIKKVDYSKKWADLKSVDYATKLKEGKEKLGEHVHKHKSTIQKKLGMEEKKDNEEFEIE